MSGNNKVKVAIIGASGYTGEELIRILLRHPLVEITCMTSREHAGKSMGSVFPRHMGTHHIFARPDIDAVAAASEVVFLCLPHGLAAEYAVPLINKGLKVFDISADFRLKSPQQYQEYYGVDHPAPHLLAQAVYGLPEKNRELIKMAPLVACPGCYPTSAILPIYPLMKEKIINPADIKICGLSGVTGSGRKVQLPFLFCECNESIRSYSLTGHRHIPEMEQELGASPADETVTLSFSAHLIPVNRGLHSTIYLSPRNSQVGQVKVEETLRTFYDEEPFVRILPRGQLSDTKHVIYTNFCEIGFSVDNRTGTIILTSAIDNLTKGASGQAVQCMNISCDFEESLGLV